MGTRADFYVGRGERAEWIGSVAMDGYPTGVPVKIRKATTEAEFRERVAEFLGKTDHATTPDQGWPWPWDDSATTDYAYAFDGDRVWGSCFGSEWFKPVGREPRHPDRKAARFPNMSARKRVALDRRSGLLFVTMK